MWFLRTMGLPGWYGAISSNTDGLVHGGSARSATPPQMSRAS